MADITLAPVGRQLRCDECRKLLPTVTNDQQQITCDRCGSVKRLPPKLETRIDTSSTFSDQGTDPQASKSMAFQSPSTDDHQDDPSLSHSKPPPSNEAEEFEIRLMPSLDRAGPRDHDTHHHHAASDQDSLDESDLLAGYSRSQAVSPRDDRTFGLVGQQGVPLTAEERGERARNLYNESAGLYPKQRHYPTLESMQRLTRLFGYVIMGTVFPYLMFRFCKACYLAEDSILSALVEFTEFAAPIIFATVGAVGSLFICSEGIKLAIDLQDNTLRIANRAGRRKD